MKYIKLKNKDYYILNPPYIYKTIILLSQYKVMQYVIYNMDKENSKQNVLIKIRYTIMMNFSKLKNKDYYKLIPPYIYNNNKYLLFQYKVM